MGCLFRKKEAPLERGRPAPRRDAVHGPVLRRARCRRFGRALDSHVQRAWAADVAVRYVVQPVAAGPAVYREIRKGGCHWSAGCDPLQWVSAETA